MAGLLLASPALLAGQVSDPVPPERVEARERFRDDRFGMFVHWGVYSQFGAGEWVMENRGLRVPEYERLASTPPTGAGSRPTS